MTRARLAVLLAMVCVAAACGDDDASSAGTGGDASGSGGAGGTAGASGSAGSGGVGGPAVWTWEQYLEASVEAICTQVLECPPQNDDQLGARSVLRTRERCRTYYGTWPQRVAMVDGYKDAIDAGRLVFDGQNAAACPALSTPCAPSSGPLADDHPCRRILVGSVPLGVECYGPDECAGSAYCASDNNSCPGICTAKLTVGQACQSQVQCEGQSGAATCDRSVEPNVCAIVPWSFTAGVGQDCGLLDDGSRAFCMPGLWCDGGFTSRGTCQPPIAIDQPCDADHPCEGLAFCDSDTETCQDITVLDQVGALCDEGGGITRRMCDPLARLICVDGRCELAGDGGQDSRCVPGDLGDASCNAGFYCEWSSHVCRPLREPGADCSSSQQCTGSCDYVTRTCIAERCWL